MSEGLSDRLRRLRREERERGAVPDRPDEGAPASPPTRAAPARLPEWMRARLAGRARRVEELELAEHPVPRTLGDPERLAPTSGPEGPLRARVERLASDHRHGDWSLDEGLAADASAFALLTGDDALAGIDLQQAVFLDTETTGLSGGAGTYVYLVGLGRFAGDHFELWQGFLSGPAEERALLAEVARRVADADAVVSFFGKSFDRHRLEDKMRIAGVAPTFAARAHLDLYHPFQRLTKGRLPDGRLATVERSLCGLVRPDDLPGSLAPAAWFDYVAGRAHRLEGVFRHNRDDVLSLVTLAGYLGRVLREERRSGEPLAGCTAARARALARAWLAAGEKEAALPWLERAIERARAARLVWRDLALARAEALRALGRGGEARSAYEELLAQGDPRPDATALDACIGLAKLCEHVLADPSAALAALERAEAIVATGSLPAPRDLARRRVRLETRLRTGCARGPGTGTA